MRYRIFLDANVLMEVILQRRKWTKVTEELAATDKQFVTSPLVIHLCYHFCLPEGVAFEKITNFLKAFEIISMNSQTVRLAQELYAGKDFEDCLQAACAEAGGCDEILTLDKNFAKNSGTKLKVRLVR